jgi:hypothetical protein
MARIDVKTYYELVSGRQFYLYLEKFSEVKNYVSWITSDVKLGGSPDSRAVTFNFEMWVLVVVYSS